MKKYLKNLSIICWCMVIVSCSNYFDDQVPKDQIDESKVFADDRMAESAMSYVYTLLRNEGFLSGNRNGGGYLLGCYTDELEVTESDAAEYSNFYKGTVTSTNRMVTGLWNSSYKQIYAVNNILEALDDNVNLSEDLIRRLRGEALAIRGIVHFYLAFTFGDVPFITTTNYTVNSRVKRQPFVEIMSKAVRDLEEAEELLHVQYSSQQKVMLNKTVVQAFLARVYLYSKEWEKAGYYAQTIIDSNVYELESLEKEFLKESKSTLWQFKPSGSGQNTVEGMVYTFVSLPPPNVRLSLNLLQSFEPDDLRKTAWTKMVMNSVENVHAYKYKQNRPTSVSLEYSVVIRLAEMYLIAAEASALRSDWEKFNLYINILRNRAGLQNLNVSNKDAALIAILKERRAELFCEFGHRFFDLKRTGKLHVLKNIKSNWNEYNEVLPIPETELILNPNLLPQNIGY